MIPIYQSAIFGLIGGIVRGVVGIVKSKKKFDPWYFLITIALSGIIGIFTGMLISDDYKMALLSGYAGMDLIEGIYKIKKR